MLRPGSRVQNLMEKFGMTFVAFSPLAQARPYSFGVGYLWRIAVDWPGSAVPPCIHRAPETLPGQPPRLVLIC